MRYPEHLKEDIRAGTDIVELVSRYVPLKKAGNTYKGLCPFHKEKTPSFTVTPSKNIFHCFGCGKGGDAFSFLMDMEHLGFMEAFEILAKDAGIDLSRYKTETSSAPQDEDPIFRANKMALHFFYESIMKNDPVLKYLEKRGIEKTTIDLFKLGYAPDGWDGLMKAAEKQNVSAVDLEKAGLLSKGTESGKLYDRFRNRLMFPIYNLSGLPVAFGGRNLKKGDKSAKYINSPETSVYRKSYVLYGLHLSRPEIRKQEYAILVEGYMDYHALFQAGFKNVIAVSGTSLTSEQARIIKRYCGTVTVIFDADAAGVKAAERGIQILTGEGLEVKVVSLPAGSDPDSLIKAKGVESMQKALHESERMVDFKISQSVKKYGLNTPEAKSHVLTEIARVIAVHPNDMIRDEYCKQVSGKIGVDIKHVSKEVLAVRKPNTREFKRVEKGEGAQRKDYGIERNLAYLLVRCPSLSAKAEDLLEGDLVQLPALKKFFINIVEFINKRSEGIADFSAGISDFEKKEQQKIVGFLSEPEPKHPELEWELQLLRLKSRVYRDKKAVLDEKLKEKRENRENLLKKLNQVHSQINETEKEILQWMEKINSLSV